jgi:hypothetical protein
MRFENIIHSAHSEIVTIELIFSIIRLKISVLNIASKSQTHLYEIAGIGAYSTVYKIPQN